MTVSGVLVREATPGDVDALVRIVNAAYRGGGGWTTERHLVAGRRIDVDGLRAMLASRDESVLVAAFPDAPCGCIHVRRVAPETCEFSLLAVDPALQGAGVGRMLLAHAQTHARERFGAALARLHVITARPELLAWYARRGYARTGERIPFLSVIGNRSLAGPLEFERLAKRL